MATVIINGQTYIVPDETVTPPKRKRRKARKPKPPVEPVEVPEPEVE